MEKYVIGEAPGIQCVAKAMVSGVTVHLLDLGLSSSLTNYLDCVYADISSKLNLPKPSKEYKWICYHADGTITEYDIDQDKFRFLDKSDPRVYSGYIQFEDLSSKVSH